MAKPTTLRWSKLSIWPSDGASPEDFTSQVCGLNAKGFSITADTSDSNVPDCDDPDLPSWTERAVRALSSGVSGSGLLAEETFAFWRAWMLSGEAKNVRIVVDLATTPGYFVGSYLLTQFELNGSEADGKLGVTLALSSDGPITWAAGAP
jgi:hypothetical protein